MEQPTSTQRDTSASASSSSSSALTPRGPDVQNSFAIISRGLQVLLDRQELEPGHIIHCQIKASSASASVSATASATASVSATASATASVSATASATASVSATASASSSSSSSASTPKGPYQVFINHRGRDVKNLFASFLYRELKSIGLQVFLYPLELKPGHPISSQIEAAIQSASVQVAIFSEKYAESKWCLDELVDMLETTRRDPISQRATILPVFYKVKRSELTRTDGGAYANAMRIHKQLYNLETIEKWKKALSDVADISGLDLEACNGDEVKLMDMVVESVLKEVTYRVFINHRGPDVKKSLASSIYSQLGSRGLKVFLDQPEMEPGRRILSQIKAAIQSASVQIAIFSKRYAESKWCLDELVDMLETTRREEESQRATILPVFYKVKPSELRRTDRGAYANDMRKHKQRCNLKTIQKWKKWKKALSDVAGISGFELEACNGDEVELVRKIVQQVAKSFENVLKG